MSELHVAMAQAGKLKQFCQAVLDVIGAVETLGPLDQQIDETKARLAQYQRQDAQAKEALLVAQALIQPARARAEQIEQEARQAAETLLRDTKAAATRQLDEAKETVRLAYEARQQLDAELSLARQTLAGLSSEIRAHEVKLADAKAAITRMLGA
jgi:cell division septum initiation protein DivIVA